jgi:hypothetical protein
MIHHVQWQYPLWFLPLTKLEKICYHSFILISLK